jgi:pectate lyase
MTKKIVIMICLFIGATLPVAAQYGRCKMTDKPVGFCTVEGGTTGGEGGRTIRVSTFDSLKEYMDSNDKLIIEVSGTIDLNGSMTALRSDKTLIGLGDNARIIKGGLELYKRNNIIIRNITFINAPDDLLKVNQNTTHLWVDHCTFTDGDTPDPDGENHDGLFDITRQSNYITISYCLFLNHSKSILIGHSDGYTDDVGYLKTTLHHNWFNGTIQRHPRVRFGEVHCFNNYYLKNELYGVASACEADVVVEGNYFENVPYPMYVGYAESPDGDIVERSNVFVNSGTPETRGTAFDPKTYYAYTLDPAADVPAIVKANVGAGGMTGVVTRIQKPAESGAAIELFAAAYSLDRTASFIAHRTGMAAATIVDARGREIAVLFQGLAIAGKRYTVKWTGSEIGKGAYILMICSGGGQAAGKIAYVK